MWIQLGRKLSTCLAAVLAKRTLKNFVTNKPTWVVAEHYSYELLYYYNGTAGPIGSHAQ